MYTVAHSINSYTCAERRTSSDLYFGEKYHRYFYITQHAKVYHIVTQKPRVQTDPYPGRFESHYS